MVLDSVGSDSAEIGSDSAEVDSDSTEIGSDSVEASDSRYCRQHHCGGRRTLKEREKLSEEFAQQRLSTKLIRKTGRELGRIGEVSEKWFREIGTGKSNFSYRN